MDIQIITPHSQRFPLLNEQSSEVKFPLEDYQRTLIRDMIAYLTDKTDGLGLAAVQVGTPQRIFVMAQNNAPKVFINPKIILSDGRSGNKPEGCLSLPGVQVRIRRPTHVRLVYQDEDGNYHTDDFRGIWARCVCHELEHCDGRLIIEHME